MKFWTLQRREVVDKALKQGLYQPDFEKSEYTEYNENLKDIYDFILESFNNLNKTEYPGLIFAFTATDNQSIIEMDDYEFFRDYCKANEEPLEPLWKHYKDSDMVVVEVEYDLELNPLFIEYNDYQLLGIPPERWGYPYNFFDDCPRIVGNIQNGVVQGSLFPSGFIQAHLPNLTKENIVAVHPWFVL